MALAIRGGTDDWRVGIPCCLGKLGMVNEICATFTDVQDSDELSVPALRARLIGHAHDVVAAIPVVAPNHRMPRAHFRNEVGQKRISGPFLGNEPAVRIQIDERDGTIAFQAGLDVHDIGIACHAASGNGATRWPRIR